MASEVQVTNDFQTAPIWDGTLKPGWTPAITNPSGTDVYLDDDPNLLNVSALGAVPVSGVRIPAGTLIPVVLYGYAGRRVYARAAARTTIFIL